MGWKDLLNTVRGDLGRIFNSWSGNAPARPANPNASFISLGPEQAVNFNHILTTGDVPADRSNPYNDKKLNLNGNDSYARAQRAINADTIRRIQHDPACNALLHKKSWTRDDRVQWERQIAFHAAQSRSAVPGLAAYRSASIDPALKHTNSPNTDLSPDIDAARKNPSAKPKSELDCKEMSLIEGMAMQNAENHFLKGQKGGPGNFKTPGNYFYMSGGESDKAKEIGGHAFIYTPLGNIVEATQHPSDGTGNIYRQALVPQPWDAVFKGKKVVSDILNTDGYNPVYGQWDSVQAFDTARQSQDRQAAKARVPVQVHRTPALSH
jgi:hypothetical protein